MPFASEVLNALAFTYEALGWATDGRGEQIEQGRLTHAQLTQAGQGVLEFTVDVGQDQSSDTFTGVHSVTPEER